MEYSKLSELQAGAGQYLEKYCFQLVVCQVLSHQLHLLQLADSVRHCLWWHKGEIWPTDVQLPEDQSLAVGDGMKDDVELVRDQVGVDEPHLLDLTNGEGEAVPGGRGQLNVMNFQVAEFEIFENSQVIKNEIKLIFRKVKPP